MLRLHARAPDGVDVFSFDGGDMVTSWILALEALMIDIIPTGKTITEIQVVFNGV
jgi:hypothetical protein